MSRSSIAVYETGFETVVIPECVAALKSDRRTHEGKLKHRYMNAISELSVIAWEMDKDSIREILP